jgi:DNA-binding transcriptional LysR family regulator
MLSSDDLRFFIALAREPTLAAAARSLLVTPSAVTQRLRGIEGRLGIRLAHRSPRGLTLTDEGGLLAERAGAILADIDAVADMLGERRGMVRGHLRVAAPIGFGRRYVAPVVLRLRRDHPDLRVTLTLSENPVRLKPDAWDVIIHIGDLPLLDLRRVVLAPNARILCAAPAYLAERGRPETPADLARHDCIVIDENDEDTALWQFTSADGDGGTVRIAPALSCNDGETARAWALAGMGIVLRSEWSAGADLAAGRLVRLLPDWRAADAPVLALLGAQTGRAARTRHFVEALNASLMPPPWRTNAV